jgi:putative ABC transport system substrate-binding protein
LVQSLAHPGGNVTVISQNSEAHIAKQLELLHQIASSAARIGFIYSTWQPNHVLDLQLSTNAARELGVELVPAPVSSTNASDFSALDQAINAAMAETVQAFQVLPPLGDLEGYKRVAARLTDLRLASVGGEKRFAEVGGLAAYGYDQPAMLRRAGYFVDRILKGTSPAELPVEFPTVWDVAINRTTAKAIGVTIPPEVALQVTEWVT